MMYETHCIRLSRQSWEWKMDIQRSRQYILLDWAGNLNQCCQTSHLYRQMHICAAQREHLVLTASDVWHLATAA